MNEGRVHSIESFGTVDGPGIRMVVFLQGCCLRCHYCHNPDTWDTSGGTLRSVESILDEYETYRPFLTCGLTVSGGEPLLQLDFVTDLFTAAKARGIHTCLDTSGGCVQTRELSFMNRIARLIEVTDLVLLDIKHINPAAHRDLTGIDNEHILRFALWLDKHAVAIRIRHVLIPRVTLDDEQLYRLGGFIGHLKHLEGVEILPYHAMGTAKWQSLGWEYPLVGTSPPTQEEINRARQVVLLGIKKRRDIDAPAKTSNIQ